DSAWGRGRNRRYAGNKARDRNDPQAAPRAQRRASVQLTAPRPAANRGAATVDWTDAAGTATDRETATPTPERARWMAPPAPVRAAAKLTMPHVAAAARPSAQPPAAVAAQSASGTARAANARPPAATRMASMGSPAVMRGSVR